MRHVLKLAFVLVLAPPVHSFASAVTSHAPSLDERIAARRAVEEVLWRHRIWPADNPQPKPPLSAVLSDAEIRARVLDDLKKSQALATLWQRPLTGTMLQAELERMARGSRAPRVLEEMLAAVGHDPVLAGEAIARPALVDRLIRSWYAQDARFHGELRRSADAGGGGTVVERTVAKDDPAWDELHDFVGARDTARVIDEVDAFRRYVVRESSSSRFRFEVTSWAKRPFASWWSEASPALTPDLDVARGAVLRAPEVNTPGSCTNDTWHALGDASPTGRYGHSAIWTGSEMIVWGGYSATGLLANGGRYEPATDSWFHMAAQGAPSPRVLHPAVWTGTQMIVWGGQQSPVGFSPLGTGARYSPVTDQWTPIALTNAPSPRQEITMVWTGSRVLLWGGTTSTGSTNTGGVYDPAGDTWAGTSTVGAPSARNQHSAVWTGDRMVIWGGQFAVVPTGGRYDPVTDTWSPVTSVGAPTARTQATAVWSGSRMLIWGGHAGSNSQIGGRYDPVADTWQLMTGTGAPAVRVEHTAVWTGSRMLIWGGDTDGFGETSDGSVYDPIADIWTPTAVPGAPELRRLHTAVWTGTEMIVWGGTYLQPGPPNILHYYGSGGRYTPSSNSWVPTSVYGVGPPSARAFHTAVWTGSEAIIWGGADPGSLLNTGARYSPATNSWWPTSTAGAPSPRELHSAVWTGTEMIAWGGRDSANDGLNTGGRFNPASDTWAPTAIIGGPFPTGSHSAVWTGSRMIVFGGESSGGVNNFGGRYDPSTDSWQSISIVGAPSARYGHLAVWTGSRMVVWGGSELYNVNSYGVDTGGRYDPSTNTWTPTSTAGAPVGRSGFTGAWTGSELLVWGGACCFDGTIPNDGGRYSPATDSWTAIPTTGAPTGRNTPRSAWTGSELIVWGGNGGGRLNTGGRYVPSKNTWSATAVTGAPAGRDWHTATWLGDRFLVFGGVGAAGVPIDTGATYCACRTFWFDNDGDGYGNGDGGAPTMETCNGTTPAGWVDNGLDCWDANPDVHPGVFDNSCNGVDENCDGTNDENYVGGFAHCGLGVCHSTGFFSCVNGSVVSDCVPGPPAAPNDSACNAQDDDCDGSTDEDFVQRPDYWTATATAPVTRTNHTSIWSGSELIVFGGDNGSGTVKVGGEAYGPSSNTWRTLSAGPAKRWRHTAVWTGSQMIVWGGDDNIATVYNTGSRYDPGSDTWSATTTTGAPLARGGHSAVWTASRMVIWGGAAGPTSMNTGSRYDPAANGWSATTTTGAPAARLFHSAVSTSTEMIVWGGQNVFGGTALSTGSRYNPTSNAWTAVTNTGAPTARYGHVAVWTGSEMIVWGGTDGTVYRNTGARYNPSTNTWTAMSGTGAPSARALASAAWTGSELFVWGGTGNTSVGDGARYNPGTDTWTAISPEGIPAARARASGVWTGTEMIVWGGDPNGASRSDGGRYNPLTVCGNGGCQRVGSTNCASGVPGFQCTPAPPTPEVCDGIDNNCNLTADEGIPQPTGHPVLFTTKLDPSGNTQFTWSPTPDTTGYDVARGSVGLLRVSGDYTSSTSGCAANNVGAPVLFDAPVPANGDAWWYLVRPINACSGNGSYDDATPPQQGGRDGEINTSGLSCP